MTRTIKDREKYNKYHREYARRRCKEDPAYKAKVLANSRRNYAKNGKRWKSNSPEAKRAVKLRNTFGLTIKQYDEKFKIQKGLCAICGRPPGKKRLAVDHNHTTGKIRNLLCTGCNFVTGWIENNPGRLELTKKYLRRWL
jgi:hypothetical protein